MTVLELLDELEEIVNTSPKLPITSKIMVDSTELLELAQDIRLSLPDDVQQAKWIKDEKEHILAEARSEYERIILEAKKQADTMVKQDIITSRARDVAGEIYRRSDEYSKTMKLRTYDYMDEVLYSFRQKMDEVNSKYFEAMYDDMNKHFEVIATKIEGDLRDLHRMQEEARNTAIPEHDIEIPVGDETEE